MKSRLIIILSLISMVLIAQNPEDMKTISYPNYTPQIIAPINDNFSLIDHTIDWTHTIKDYGAYCDGIHDDMPYIVEACNDKGYALIPRGAYVDSKGDIPANSLIIGRWIGERNADFSAGPGSFIKIGPDIDSTVFNVTGNYVKFMNLRFYGGGDSLREVIYDSGQDYVYFENLVFDDLETAREDAYTIHLLGFTINSVFMRNILMHGRSQYPFGFYNECQNLYYLQADNVTVRNFDSVGFYTGSTLSTMEINGMDIESNGEAGMQINGNGGIVHITDLHSEYGRPVIKITSPKSSVHLEDIWTTGYSYNGFVDMENTSKLKITNLLNVEPTSSIDSLLASLIKNYDDYSNFVTYENMASGSSRTSGFGQHITMDKPIGMIPWDSKLMGYLRDMDGSWLFTPNDWDTLTSKGNSSIKKNQAGGHWFIHMGTGDQFGNNSKDWSFLHDTGECTILIPFINWGTATKNLLSTYTTTNGITLDSKSNGFEFKIYSSSSLQATASLTTNQDSLLYVLGITKYMENDTMKIICLLNSINGVLNPIHRDFVETNIPSYSSTTTADTELKIGDEDMDVGWIFVANCSVTKSRLRDLVFNSLRYYTPDGNAYNLFNR